MTLCRDRLMGTHASMLTPAPVEPRAGSGMRPAVLRGGRPRASSVRSSHDGGQAEEVGQLMREGGLAGTVLWLEQPFHA